MSKLFFRPALILSGKMYRFRVDPEILEPRFFEAFLLSPTTQAIVDTMKTGISDSGLNLTHGRFRRLPVLIAPLPEQSRIADRIDELFTELTAGVAALEQVKLKLKRYRSAILHAAVTGRLTAKWRDTTGPPEEPGSKLLERILVGRRRQWEELTLAKYAKTGRTPPKDWQARYPEPAPPNVEGLADLPKAWCWASMDQCADVQGGLQKSPARSPIKNHFPYLRVANVLRGRLDLAELHRFELKPEELAKLRLNRGDLLIVEGNGSLTEIGRSALWMGEVINCVHQNHIIRCRFSSDIAPEYVDTFVNSPLGQQYMRNVASSTSGLHTLSVGKVRSIVCSLPPIAEQAAIVEIVNEKESQINAMEAEVERGLARAGRLRQAILKAAFAGTLVPQDPNDEPASALLKRITDLRAQVTQASNGNNGKRHSSSSKRKRVATKADANGSQGRLLDAVPEEEGPKRRRRKTRQ